MPRVPKPFRMLDWAALARRYDASVFDFERPGEYFPLIWIDDARRNFDQPTFGLYTVVGDPRMGPDVHNGEAHEAITCIAAVLGASLVGIDKSNQGGHDYVQMCANYFNRENGWNIVMDFTSDLARGGGGGYGGSFWYDLFPNVLFFALADCYPNHDGFNEIIGACADQLYAANRILDNNYAHTYFDFSSMRPVDNGRWIESDSAAGFAWLSYMAYVRLGDDRYLETAIESMNVLARMDQSPFYEVLLPFGACVAARLNAEQGTSYDVARILEWCFSGESTCRPGWGVLSDSWNGYDVHGLQGSRSDGGGYAFAMNTFDIIAALAPLPRYAPEFAADIGRWILNAANAARLFYPSELPPDLQTSHRYAELTDNVIAYEGLRKYDSEGLTTGDPKVAETRSPFAQGDSHRWGRRSKTTFPEISHLSLYGSSHVGLLASVIKRSGEGEALVVDCARTDFFGARSQRTFLVYNPWDEPLSLKLAEISPVTGDVYDLVGEKFVARSGAIDASITLNPDSVAMLVFGGAASQPGR